MAQHEVNDPLAGSTKYKLIQPLSSGAFGVVHLYRNLQTNEKVAIKFLGRGDEVSKYVEFEIQNHRILRHPHVIGYKEVFLTKEHICIAMEYASAGTLFSHVQQAGRLQEPAARWFFQQLVLGLDYCHRKGIVNRDIKLENILLEKVDHIPLPLVKICDFGYSKSQVMSAPKSKVGTLAYMAPEVIRATAYDGKLADIWSCGVMLYVMLFGKYPFDGPPAPKKGAQKHASQDMMTRIMNVQYQIPADVPISPYCRDLMERLIVADPSKRLTMAQIQQHPWFLSNLPKEALSMNDQCLANNDYSGVQSAEEISEILKQAYQEGGLLLDDMINEIIDEEVDNEEGFAGIRQQVQGQVAQVPPQQQQQQLQMQHQKLEEQLHQKQLEVEELQKQQRLLQQQQQQQQPGGTQPNAQAKQQQQQQPGGTQPNAQAKQQPAAAVMKEQPVAVVTKQEKKKWWQKLLPSK